MRRIVVLSLVLCSALLSQTSEARPRRARVRVRVRASRPQVRVAVVPLSGSGKGAVKLAASATRALIKSLRRSRTLQARVLEQRRAAKLRLCLQESECVRTLASSLGTSLLITGHVEPQGTGFHVDLRVVAGASGEAVQSEGLDLAATSGGSAARLGLRLLDRARRGASAVAARRTTVDAPERFSTSEAESASAIVEARDTEDPLTRKAAASRPAPKKVAVAVAPSAPVETEVMHDSWTAGRLFSRRFAATWTLAVVGLGTLGASVAFGVISKRANDDARAAESQLDAWPLRDKAQKNALVANILFGVGGAAALTSTILFIVEYRRDRAECRSVRKVRVAVDVTLGGGAIVARGVF
jgi:hypothetical protein